MYAERDYLVTAVFPQLRDWCDRRKLHLIDVDLRWGVTETDATYNKHAVQVCLDRIDQCRPFFISLLGQRYGWVPRPENIAEDTCKKFPGLSDAVKNQLSFTDMEISHAVLKPFHKGSGKKEKSYTPAKHSFFYLRDNSYLSDLPSSPSYLRHIYTDQCEKDEESRNSLEKKLNKLKKDRIMARGCSIRDYQVKWLPNQRTPEIAMSLQCPSAITKNQKHWKQEWMEKAEIKFEGLNINNNPDLAAKAKTV